MGYNFSDIRDIYNSKDKKAVTEHQNKLVTLLSIPTDKSCKDWVLPNRFNLRASDLDGVRMAAKLLLAHNIHLVPLFSATLMEEFFGKDFMAKSEVSYLYLSELKNPKSRVVRYHAFCSQFRVKQTKREANLEDSLYSSYILD